MFSATFKNNISSKDHGRGFSLVEMMVALSIFSIVMVISVGTLLIMIDINAKAQALYSSTTNLSFALDSMTREIRTGARYYCTGTVTADQGLASPNSTTGGDCSGGKYISFARGKDDNVRIGYRLFNKAIQQKTTNGGPNWINITSNDVIVETFDVTVTGSVTITDQDQPVVDIVVKGYVSNGLDTNTDFNIQTRIIQHKLDL